MEHVEIDGVRIAYTRGGSGPTLVMAHGAPADSRTWQWMVADLSADHTVVAWDAPGFGQSSDIHDTWRAAQFADALAAFIETLGLQRPHVVGHSFGSMVALSLFERHSLLPGSLVLVGGYAGWAGSLPPEEVARRLDMFVGMADLGDAFDPKSYPGLFTDLIPADRAEALVRMMRENIRPASIRAAGHVGAETDLRPMLATIGIPTLVLHGEADARSPLKNAQALHAAISDISAHGASEARSCVHGGGSGGLRDGDPTVRQAGGLRALPCEFIGREPEADGNDASASAQDDSLRCARDGARPHRDR